MRGAGRGLHRGMAAWASPVRWQEAGCHPLPFLTLPPFVPSLPPGAEEDGTPVGDIGVTCNFSETDTTSTTTRPDAEYLAAQLK